MKSAIIIGGIALLLIGFLFVWGYSTHERVENVIETGPNGEARYNQLLAAERLMSRLGFNADSRAGFDPHDWLPRTYGTPSSSFFPG